MANTLGDTTVEAIQLLNKLRNEGADVDIDLPRIVFAGKQSAGKSSVVEAVTGVQLPRDAGTCTRCPIEVITEHSEDDWACTISLRKEYGADGRRLPQPDVDILPPVRDRSSLAKEIYEAQKQLLQEGEQRFTRNVVTVKLTGREFVSLSIVDLPGLIASTKNEDHATDISQVETLVTNYLSKSNTVIVQCLQSDEDMENQSILALARTADREGGRTIGVMTKPDRVEPAARQRLKSLLGGGEDVRLVKGYYTVRTPDETQRATLETKEPKEQRQEAQRMEEDFFSSDPIGKELASQGRKGRCGAANLKEQLGKMLRELVDSQVPSLHETARRLVEETEAELEHLGAHVEAEDAPREAQQIVSNIVDKVRNHVSTNNTTRALWKRLETVFDNVQAQLSATAPVFEVDGHVTLWTSCDEHHTDDDGFFPEALFADLLGSSASDVTKFTERQPWRSGRAISIAGLHWTVEVHVADKTPTTFGSAAKQDVFWRLSAELPTGVSAVVVSVRSDMESRGTCKVSSRGVEQTNVSVPTEKWTSAGSITFPSESSGTTGFQLRLRLQSPTLKPAESDKTLNIQRVKELLEKYRGRELRIRGAADYNAAEGILKDAISKWATPASDCLSDVTDNVRAQLTSMSDLPGGYKSVLKEVVPTQFPRLFRQVQEALDMLVDEQYVCAEGHVERLVRIEKDGKLYTANSHYLAENRRKYELALRDGKRKATGRGPSSGETVDGDEAERAAEKEDEAKFRQLLAKRGLTPEQLEAAQKLFSSSSLDDNAIQIMADVLAYFRVKFKYFVDALFQSVQHDMLDCLAERTREHLSAQLRLDGDKGDIADLFAESDRARERRHWLRQVLERQRKHRDRLAKYERTLPIMPAAGPTVEPAEL